MRLRPDVPPALVAGLVLAVALDTAVQISWKLAVSHLPPDAGAAAALSGAARNPWFLAAMIGLGLQLINWLAVLSKADLSFAQPITALSYVSVLVLSRQALHEEISPLKLVGVALILAGVYFISRTHGRARPPAQSGVEGPGAPTLPAGEPGGPGSPALP